MTAVCRKYSHLSTATLRATNSSRSSCRSPFLTSRDVLPISSSWWTVLSNFLSMTTLRTYTARATASSTGPEILNVSFKSSVHISAPFRYTVDNLATDPLLFSVVTPVAHDIDPCDQLPQPRSELCQLR